jgi:drug/metabolite transporter (DMT)-like permease
MAVLLALFGALTYGLSDFVGGLVSRRASAWSVAVVAQLSSAACTVAVAVTGTGSPHAPDFGWAVLAGVGSGIGVGFLYRGFSSGRMSVVAPISAVGSAVVPILAGTVTGERPAVLVWVGIALALPGVWLVSSAPAPGPGESGAGARTAAGVLDGVLAGLGFGVLFAALGQIPAGAGLWPLAVAQLASIPAVIAISVVLGARWVPRGRSVWWALVAGPLGAAATLLFLLASQRGFLTVAGVLVSLYPATTVLLASLVLRERIHRAQGLGLGLCALAVALVAGA